MKIDGKIILPFIFNLSRKSSERTFLFAEVFAEVIRKFEIAESPE